jgi:6,7-dimethyl-8-ribityllumazine synthase
MAVSLPSRPRFTPRASHHYAIVESLYNEEFVKPMADAACVEIHEIEPTAAIDRVVSPGAFEIPLIVQAMLERKKYQAVIALGVILKGETAHADLIARSVTDSLQRLSLEFRCPVIHEVLLVANKEQATKRCLEPELNRGIEAARAAVNAARILEEINPPVRRTVET